MASRPLVAGAAILIFGCAPSLLDRVRGQAHALSHDELRLECALDHVAIRRVRDAPHPVTGEPRAVTNLSSAEVTRLMADGELYVAWCRSPGCCGRPEGDGLESVAVHCSAAGICEVVGDTLGACLGVHCATF